MKAFLNWLATPFVWLYHKTHWFTDAEAWGVYRFFAYGEAITWALLLFAIFYRSMGWPEAPSVISYAGQVHGLMMMVYCIIIVVVARSMEWRFGMMLLAVVSGIPPFGSLVFEQIMARRRKLKPVYVRPPKGLEE